MKLHRTTVGILLLLLGLAPAAGAERFPGAQWERVAPEAGGWSREKLVPAAEIVAQIGAEFPLEPVEGDDPSAPARRFRYRDGVGTVGVIASVTQPFCGHCDRIRLTADGQIRTCLFSLKEYDFRRAMRAGASDEEIAALLRAAVLRKEPGHLINSPFFRQPERGMSAIGG